MVSLIDFEWLKSHLKNLTEKSKELSKIDADVFYPAKQWSPLKLVALMLYLNFYTKVISKWYPHFFYIDFLADSGINRIKETGDVIAGSPLIATYFSSKPFEKMFFVEFNEKSANALNKRLEKLNASKEVFHGDCNEKIDNIIKKISIAKSHYLAFIDCEGLEIKWKTMEKLLEMDGDIIFNFQTQEVRRVWGQANSGIVGSEKKLNEFFGDETWKNAKNEFDLIRCYENKLHSYRTLIEDINVYNENPSFHYNLIFAVKKTKSGSPWFDKVMTHLKNQIENNTGESVKMALDILTGRTLTLEKFI